MTKDFKWLLENIGWYVVNKIEDCEFSMNELAEHGDSYKEMFTSHWHEGKKEDCHWAVEELYYTFGFIAEIPIKEPEIYLVALMNFINPKWEDQCSLEDRIFHIHNATLEQRVHALCMEKGMNLIEEEKGENENVSV